MSVQANPSYTYEAITPSDTATAVFSGGRVARAVYVGGAGDFIAIDRDGNEVTFAGCPAGLLLPVRIIRIKATGTTATNLVALF